MSVDFRSLANESIRSLTPYEPGKPIETLERELGITSSIKLASNENPLGASPHAIAAAKTACEHAEIYPDGNAYELKQTLSQFINVMPAQLTIGNGSENILELIIKAYLQKNDTAIISQYAFLTIPILLQSYAANMKVVPAVNYGHDTAAMIDAIDDKTKMIFLVNPNNPTGTYTSKKQFEQLLQSIPKHILLIVDEAYSEYINQADYPTTLSYLNDHPNLIVTRTFSKVYGLAALRLGYSISSPEIADILNRARLPFNVNTVAAKAGIAALKDQEHVQKSVALNQQGMQQIEEALQKLNIDYIPTLCNFLTIDVHNGKEVYQKLLYEGVIVRPLNAYGLPKHIRVTIGTKEQNERFLKSLVKCMPALMQSENL